MKEVAELPTTKYQYHEYDFCREEMGFTDKKTFLPGRKWKKLPGQGIQ